MFSSAVKTAIVALSLSSAASALAQQQTLNIYNWTDYIGPKTIEKFEAQTGIKVVYDVFDSNDTLEVKLLTGQSGYDLVVPSHNFMARQIEADLFLPLDKKQLTNYSQLDPILMARLDAVDPGNTYGVPYLWGTTGIAINEDMVKAALGEHAALDSWSLLFDPATTGKLSHCGINLLDAWDEVIPSALSYAGADVTTHSTKVMKSEAVPVLNKIRGDIKTLHSSSYINGLVGGDVCVTMAWSGDAQMAKDRSAEAETGMNISYIIPKEGAGLWFDMMVIPKDAPNPEAAHLFLDYLMRPEVIAEVTNYVGYPNAIPASLPLLDAEIRDNKGVYPSEQVMNNLFMFEVYPPAVDRFGSRLWGRFRAGR
ncbi:Spermidine-binding periplasmic protein SpuE [Sinobacterium norvegicum]|uniref:Putrescine-binding periplasmic protein n=2 Tax=Sinobacterium norvegicum TaxID=1641715 RepID=A0ABM9AAW5_9GAMM|nr:Spermidine-binding periplasmic protein SpuE [Sinobacterium norvegicum]